MPSVFQLVLIMLSVVSAITLRATTESWLLRCPYTRCRIPLFTSNADWFLVSVPGQRTDLAGGL
jgi:hypothetical protein